MYVCTCGNDMKPSARFVLCKDYDERGLCFFTNYESRKSQQLNENQNIAATFWWGDIERSIRIEGRVEKLSGEESDEYFASRMRGS